MPDGRNWERSKQRVRRGIKSEKYNILNHNRNEVEIGGAKGHRETQREDELIMGEMVFIR